MGLDIRLPIGIMFTILGGLLTVYGAVADSATFQRSLGLNVDLLWGAALLAFGLTLMFYGRRAMRRVRR
jgi:hypothetical protein